VREHGALEVAAACQGLEAARKHAAAWAAEHGVKLGEVRSVGLDGGVYAIERVSDLLPVAPLSTRPDAVKTTVTVRVTFTYR